MAWLAGMPEAQLRAELVELVGSVPGVSLSVIDCRQRPCQANVTAPSREALNELLRLAHARFRGHLAVVATADPTSPAGTFVASVTVGTESVIDEPPVMAPR